MAGSSGVKITINKETMRKLDSTGKERMLEAVNELRNVTIDILSQRGTGRTYTHYFWTDAMGQLRRGRERWKPHTASAPGKPPARDTSHLVQSIKGKVTRGVGWVGTDSNIGIMMQYGTKKIAPRPWLDVAANKAREKIKQIFSRKWL